MATLLLLIIYVAFIGLGLPDSILGSAWPAMHSDLNAALNGANLITMIISAGTIISSLLSERIIRRFGTGIVTLCSVFATAVALLGFSFSNNIIWLIVLALPLGLGAGSVDAALNNYVALYYKPRHMSWLHCFWGIGAFTGPMIMSWFIKRDNNWRSAYLTVSIIQFVIVFFLILSMAMWRKDTKEIDEKPQTKMDSYNAGKSNYAFRIPGVKAVCIVFLFYSGIEGTLNYWGSSFLVYGKGFTPAEAAKWVAFIFAGITGGRLLTGFLTEKFSNTQLIRFGSVMILLSAIITILPFGPVFTISGIIGMGFGCAPIFPCMLHETPERFGADKSQKIMGIQMAAAYTGATFLPPVFNLIASKTTMEALPVFMLIYSLILLSASEYVNFLKRSKTIQS